MQRILIAGWLLVLACSLHVLFCDWLVRSVPEGSTFPMIAYDHGVQPVPPPRNSRNLSSGLFCDRRVGNTRSAWAFGVLLPLTLVVTDAYLLLGWRNQSRIAHNLCTKCGYDLRGSEADSCPECGTKAHR